MNVGTLLDNYAGEIEFWDSNAEGADTFVARTFGGSPLIGILSDMEVVKWEGVPSTKYPKIRVYCAFTEPEPEEVVEEG